MQLTHIIRETRYLDRMTFTIPECALNVTLQEDRYLQCVDGLTDMLERYYKVHASCTCWWYKHFAACDLICTHQQLCHVKYAVMKLHTSPFVHHMVGLLLMCPYQEHQLQTRVDDVILHVLHQCSNTRDYQPLPAVQVLDRLTPIEQQLLSQRLTQLRHVLDPGFSPLNWNSLGIPDFVAICNKVGCTIAHIATLSHRYTISRCGSRANNITCGHAHQYSMQQRQ